MKDSTIQSSGLILHDIKPLLEIEDYSFYYFLALSIVVIFLVLAIIYLIVKWFKNRNKFNIRVENYKLLNKIDLEDTKNSAYLITLYGTTFKDDSQRHKEMFENINSRLESYKYKKNVPKFDDETLSYIEIYRGMIDV